MDGREEDRAWDHRQHLNDDFNNLSNYFLLAQSFLIAAATSSLTAHSSTLLRVTTAVLGLLLTFVWMHVQGKQRFLLSLAKRRCEELFPDYRACELSVPTQGGGSPTRPFRHT
jgi:hypothetical protein